MTSPLVSVLLPVRDGGRFLADAIRSITQQTFADFEVVAVDDGSADDTRDLLDSWVRSDFRVTVIRQGALGLVPALETARRQARGEFLARMDADDVAEPRRLELQLDLLRRDPELVGCGCRVEYFPEGEVRDGARRYERWINSLIRPEDIERDLFVECPLAHPSFFLRSEAVRVVGGYRDPGWPEDYDLVMRLWRAGHRFGSVPEVLLRWRERPDRLSRTDPRYSPEAFRRCKVHYLKRTLLEGRNGVVVWGAGPTGKGFARTLLSEGVLLRAFVDLDARKIGQEIHGAPVVRPEGVDRYLDALCVAAVGQPGARAEIREALTELGWREGEEFVAVA